MVKIALADDDAEFMESMRGILERYFGEREMRCRTDLFRNPELLYIEYEEGRTYDICFLDIEMRQMDGRELARRIRERDRAVYLIYLTAHGEFIRAGYQVGAFDFLVKEDIRRELPDVLDRLLFRMKADEKKIYQIVTHSRYEKIVCRDLIYIYKQGQNARFVLTSGEKQERTSLRKVIQALNSEEFVFVERGYIVNLSHVVSVGPGRIELSNGQVLPAGREYVQRLREKLGMYSMHRLETMGDHR